MDNVKFYAVHVVTKILDAGPQQPRAALPGIR